MEYLAAFTIGLIGSLHCIGMCGPIALALPVGGYTMGGRLWAAVLYNIGRAVTYSLLGLIFGSVGMAVWLAGIQQGFSITVGIFIILLVVIPMAINHFSVVPAFYSRLLNKLKQALQIQLQKRGFVTLFTIGLLNGLLPCGFVYVGLAGATATGHWYSGAIYMALFGLGTLPVMATLIIVKHRINLSFQRAMGKVIPYAMVTIGLLFIVRGMNLGIPYLSPSTTTKEVSAEYCKHDGHAPMKCH